MTGNRRFVLCVAAVCLVLGIATCVLSRPREWQAFGGLRLSDVHEIKKTVVRERWGRVIRGITTLEFRIASQHIQETLRGRKPVVTARGTDEAIVEIFEATETGRRWDYQLERQTNGWKVVGVGYRSALIRRAPTDRVQ